MKFSSILTQRAFWEGALERTLKTFCYTLLALMGATATGIEPGAVPDFALHTFEWLPALSTALFAAIISILGSIASATPLPIAEPAASVSAIDGEKAVKSAPKHRA